MTALAVVRNIDSPRALRTTEDAEDFEQEIVDQYALAMAAAGLSDGHVAHTRSVIVEFARSLDGPLWSASCEDADRFLAGQRRAGRSGVHACREGGGAGVVLRVRDRPLSGRHPRPGGVVVEQPIDEFNRQRARRWGRCGCRRPTRRSRSCSPAGAPVVPQARKYLPAARDYFAASLWRRLGLRINETVMLDIRDWRPDLGEFGKLHVRHGKGSRGRGPKARLVPAINGADTLIDWWLAEVRHQFGR